MEQTVYNPQKERLETISIDFTADNTTWFDPCEHPDDIRMITDFDGDLLHHRERQRLSDQDLRRITHSCPP